VPDSNEFPAFLLGCAPYADWGAALIAMEKQEKQKRLRLSLAAVLICNSVVMLSMASGFLFKHGPELIFGLQARTWGFGVLGLMIVSLTFAMVIFVTALKQRP